LSADDIESFKKRIAFKEEMKTFLDIEIGELRRAILKLKLIKVDN